jgi:hypothetical protein
MSRPSLLQTGFLWLLICQLAWAQSGKVFEVMYAGSEKVGELPYGVTYTVWIPENAEKLRGIIVHQHGCGTGACQGGATAALDLHWQALAAKWQCALLGPSYHQVDGQDCRLWCDPRKGSEQTFLKSLRDLGDKANRPELSEVPWCLWGHSGGGFWASILQTKYPERIVAIWCRSGTAFATWEKGEIAKPELTAGVYRVPVMLNPGAKERDHERFKGAWDGAMAMFKAYRAHGAPVGFAPDPRTAHECGDSRYLAIPFFDACLEMRLPNIDSPSQALKPVDMGVAHLAPIVDGEVHSDKVVPASDFQQNVSDSVWLPTQKFASAWQQYVQTGGTEDSTPPASPHAVSFLKDSSGNLLLTWQCEADLESGLQQFIVTRNGQEIGRVPTKPIGKFGRPLFQTMSYHDTPELPLPEMRFVSVDATPGDQYAVIAVNSASLQSAPSAVATEATSNR